MPEQNGIPITDNFKRLIAKTREQEEAVKGSKVMSDSKGVSYVNEQKKRMPEIWATDLGVRDTDVSKEFKWAYDKYQRNPEVLDVLDKLFDSYYTDYKRWSEIKKETSN